MFIKIQTIKPHVPMEKQKQKNNVCNNPAIIQLFDKLHMNQSLTNLLLGHKTIKDKFHVIFIISRIHEYMMISRK